MPPHKRSKKPSPPPDQASSPGPGNPTDGGLGDSKYEEAGVHSSPESFESIDPALLDEEEAPASPEDGNVPTHQTSEVSQEGDEGVKKYATGGGGYNSLKSFKGQVYSGMSIGGSHKWNYDEGVWQETKQEPDLWNIDYKTNKTRARKAPKNSGAPVGTEYHWLIVGHQVS